MQPSSIAQAAQSRGVPFAAVKAISDETNFALPPMEHFISRTGQFRAWSFSAFVLLRPWWWGNVLKLARNSARASDALCSWLARLPQASAALADEVLNR